MSSQRGFALKLQELPTDQDRVLVLGDFLGLQRGSWKFTTSDVSKAFDAFRVPKPANISARLGELRDSRLLVRMGSEWALTPIGRQKAQEIVGSIDPARIEAELKDLPGANLGHARHSTMPPSLAPQRWAEPISRLLKSHPFETNVFCMTRFPKSEGDTTYLDPVAEVIPALREALQKHGLIMHLASDRQLDDDLLGNVAAHMWACQYGIGLIEERIDPLNPNVMIELGAMVMTGRRCAFLRDSKTAPTMPTDFVGQIYKDVDFDEIEAIRRTAHSWAALDLGLGACDACSQIPARA